MGIIKNIRWIAVVAAVMIVISSCSSDGEEPGPTDDVVQITLRVSGQVTNGTNPIEGIQVKVFDTNGVGLTNHYGTFSIETPIMATLGDAKQTILIVVTDIDGDKNGRYKTRIVEYPIGVWYDYQAVLKELVIIMEPE